jgi:hypothetical protein
VTRGASPWSDPAVETGFAAAYAPVPPAQERRHVDVAAAPGHPEDVDDAAEPPVPTVQDDQDEAADLAARPLTRSGRRARAPQPARLSPARAVAGAAVSVSGVLLGIATLLWVSDDPSQRAGPVVQEPPAPVEQELATQPEAETAPVDPVEPVTPPVQSAAPPVAAPAPPAPAGPPRLPLTVLNNSRTTGLADRAAATFRAGGWPVQVTGNFRGRIRATTVYYEPGQEASARAFARRFAGIERVLPRFDGLPGSGLTVVLTRDFA